MENLMGAIMVKNERIERLVMESCKVWRRKIRRILPSVYEVDDVLQDVYLAALKQSQRNPDFLPTCSWCCTAAKNAAISLLRKEKLRSHIDLGSSGNALSCVDKCQVVEEEERGALLKAAVSKLPTTYRGTIERIFWGKEDSPSEVAKNDGVPIQTVRTRMKRAISQLRSTSELAKIRA